MKIFHRIVLLVFSLSVFNITAQNFKFADVTKKELASVADDVFPEADAAILNRAVLFKYGRALYFSERIKIYKKEGFEYSNFETNFDNIKFLEAHIYNLEDGEIVRAEVSKKNIFKEMNDGLKKTKFAFPNVKEGSILELFYKVENIGMKYLYTQAFIPTKKLKIVIQNPGRSRLNVSENPMGKVFLNRTENSYEIQYSGKDIPAIRKEKYVQNINNYRGKLLIERTWGNQYGEVNTWGDIAERYNNQKWFGIELKSSGNFYKKELQRILGSETDNLKRAKIIYYYLQDRMTWNSHYSRGADKIRETFISKKGDAGDINLLLTSMLRKAGINANPTLVASKNRGVLLFPTFSGFNNLISAVEIDGEFYLLDASQKKASFGLINKNFMSGDGLLIYDDDSYELVPTRADTKSIATSLVEMSISPQEMIVSGKVKRRITNHFAWEFRKKYENSEGNSFEENLTNNVGFLTISNFSKKNFDDVQNPIDMSYTFEYEDNIEFMNDEIYFQPLLFFGISENVFKNEKRLFPIDYEYPFQRKYVINCKIPDGYKIKVLPQAQNISIQDNLGKLKYSISSNGSHVQISFSLEINYALIPAHYYAGLKSLYQEYFQISESKIVLSKIDN